MEITVSQNALPSPLAGGQSPGAPGGEHPLAEGQSLVRAGIENDAAAVAAFMRQLELSPLATERAYAKEVRRFLAWLLYAGYPPGNALAQLNVLDLETYFAFLRSPMPLVKPDGSYWKRPAALAAASLELARSRLSVFFEKLESLEQAPGVPFRSGNPIKGMGRVVSARRDPRLPGEKVGIAGEEDQEHLLSVEDITFVQESIERMPKETPRDLAHYHRCRWVLRLAYHSWLRISEMARLQMGDFEFKDGLWRIYVWPSKHAKKAAVIDAFPALMDSLADYRKSLRKLPYPFTAEKGPAIISVTERRVPQAPVKTILASGALRIEEQPALQKPLTERALFAILKQIFSNAADLASGEAAARLRAASPHWLRHSGITHALNRGLDPRYVARQARHKGILTTLGTYDGGPTRVQKIDNMLKMQCC